MKASAKKKPDRESNSNTVGDVKDNSGNTVIGVGKNIDITLTSEDKITSTFAVIMKKVEDLPQSQEKEDARLAVQKLEDEARQDNHANAGRVQRWFRFLADASPDIYEVAVNTIANPLSGISTVLKKVAERAKLEAQTKK